MHVRTWLAPISPTDPFAILKPQSRSINKLYVAQKCDRRILKRHNCERDGCVCQILSFTKSFYE